MDLPSYILRSFIMDTNKVLGMTVKKDKINNLAVVHS
jgi:hypothetical protein